MNRFLVLTDMINLINDAGPSVMPFVIRHENVSQEPNLKLK